MRRTTRKVLQSSKIRLDCHSEFAASSRELAIDLLVTISVHGSIGYPLFPSMKKLSRLFAAILAIALTVPIEAVEAPKLPQKAESIVLPKFGFLDANVIECVQFFMKTSRELDPDWDGVPIALDGPRNNLPLVTFDGDKVSLADGIRKLAEVANLDIRVDGELVHLKSKFAEPKLRPKTPSGPRLTAKAESMIVPKCILVSATIDECVEFFMRKSRELEPAKNGVKIILDGPRDEVTAVNIIANNASLAENIRKLAQLADLEIRVEGEMVRLITKLKEPRLIPKGAPPSPVIPGLEPVSPAPK
jgi:type III secretion system FlhB-like substrate exporter